MAAELFDLAENLIDVARIFAQDPALENQRISLAGAVAHLTQTVDALIGVDAKERAGHRRTFDHGKTQIRNLEVRRLRVAVHVLDGGIKSSIRPKACADRRRSRA